jgi:signal transduction histidine kinase
VKRRILLLVLATSSLILVGFLVPLAMLIRATAADRAVAATTLEIQAMAPVVASAPVDRLGSAVAAINSDAAHPVTVFLPGGRTEGVPADRSEAVDQSAAGRSLSADVPGGREVLVAVSGRPEGVVVVRAFVPDRELWAGVQRAWLTLCMLGLGLLAVCAVVADRLARSLTRPLKNVAAAAEQLATAGLDARAELAGPPEVRQVAASLNRLARGIHALLAHERESAADLSHRLRTPLTALRIDADTLADPAERARMIHGLDTLEHAVDDIIRLARRPPVATTGQVCDAAAIVRERASFWSVLADEEERPFSLAVPPGAVIVGLDADSLSACVDALLVNVFNHTPEGCALSLELLSDGASGGARLSVTDRGPGGVDADLMHRGASGGHSTGLGLDIVRRTAAASGGDMTVASGPDGTSVVLHLGPSMASQLQRDVRTRHRFARF